MCKVSVLMPCYNASEFVGQTIESILNQTYKDFEFIIIDDASSDGSLEILEKYQREDNRIRIYTNSTNLGIAKTRNKAIELAKGDWIAVMDSDDISPVDRLEKQVSFIEKNPDYNAVFGNYQFIDVDGNLGKVVAPSECENKEIRAALFFRCMLPHGTAFLKRDFLVDNKLFYTEKYPALVDYLLWTDFVNTQGANVYKLIDVLEYYRYNPNGISSKTRKHKQRVRNAAFDSIHMKNLNYWGFDLNVIYLKAYLMYINPEFHCFCDVIIKLLGKRAIRSLEKQASSIIDEELKKCFLEECKRFH